MAMDLDLGLETYVWPDAGSEPTNYNDAVYEAGSQPIDSWDNFWNYSTSQDLRTVRDGVAAIADRMPPGDDSLEGRWLSKTNPELGGPLDLNGYDMIGGARTIWNASNQYIQQSALQNDSVTINTGENLTGGGQIRLGRSMSIDVDDTSFVDRTGDIMVGNLGFTQNSGISTAAHVEISDINTDEVGYASFDTTGMEIYSTTNLRDYPLWMLERGGAEGAYANGIAFSSSTDTREQTPGAAISYQRQGSWGAGQLTFRTKEEESLTGVALRRLTLHQDGTADFYNNELARTVVENRTSDPSSSSAPAGRIYYRTDLDES